MMPASAPLVAAMGSPTAPREVGTSPGMATSEAAAAAAGMTANSCGPEDSSVFSANPVMAGECRRLFPSLEFVLANDGSFTDWLKSMEVYHLVEHALDKNQDCRDFNSKRIEGLLLLKVRSWWRLDHQQTARQELQMP
ncbi:hypothetical protein BESB_019370 [Besnoitia besnoiti]|uniref:Uncharacterized protein n=1 Tax=Besnoitia besnoiti TaxID=94643 RepID=A0A2A9M7X4_BESBE|nr:hypothetical protein BESB_019370 [Besnoitia besnoiti]PFH31996.1 hypothetical protein BESB_019370 [Besnoitia besnoiti]